ncbi:hypothetical protein PSH89_23145 [Pseudomonas sp. FP1911]|uniref:hypothetical protein n=1 Tax=Pseudomonas TaxID=286 RepID=UPI00049A6AB7|nr:MULTISPECIES: hypothetical protein [Pseudomonas]AOS75763.1 hypothetical protein BH711_18065 [Pseudomonas fluorescens]AIB44004.1 hypothetical protein PD374_23670 [Pseudomonas sp. WCS374]MBY8951552.1 hypothetical protein [Pseudomonas carnis]MCK3823884.1 hypothetical protein [Pseudomonas sp. W2Aug9]WLG78791.1 hypothetical protein PSH89_23145 [Pseudomonas sp. FP1911]
MSFPTLNLKLSQRHFDEMVKSDVFLPDMSSPTMDEIRRQFLAIVPLYDATARSNASGPGAYDMKVGLALYRVLSEAGMDIRTAADDGWWRFLSLRVLPDLVRSRWDSAPPVRYWKGRSRIWLRAMWWTVHLTWQGSEESTRKVLESVTTDTVVQLVERPGKGGFRIDLTRLIFKMRRLRKPSQDQFRAIMKLNTAQIVLKEPLFCEGGLFGYVDALFADVGCAPIDLDSDHD